MSMRTVSRLASRTVARMAGVLLAGAMLTSQSAEPPECGDFRRLLKAAPAEGFLRYQLQLSSQPGDEEQYFNLDIDGDDVNDVVQGGCSASVEAADPCVLLIEFSSGQKLEFEFEIGERFLLMRHKAKIYALGTLVKRDQSIRSILKLSPEGITRICTGL